MDLLDQLDTFAEEDTSNEDYEMPESQAAALSKVLIDGDRKATYPNKFDRDLPYRVAVKVRGTWNRYGMFSNVEVASAVGSIVCMALYGKTKKNKGTYDKGVVNKHPEYKAWMANEDYKEVRKMLSK